MNLENKILNKIKEEKIQPRPFWYFLIKDYSLWAFVFLSILLASFAIAPIIFILSNLEYGSLKHLTNSPLFFILLVLPYPWIILCLITTYLAKLSWSKTKHGYKFKGENVIIISVLSSFILAILFNIFHLGKMLDEKMKDPVFDSYRSVENRYNQNWFNPSEGRLIGNIESISTSTFYINNLKNNFYQNVYFDESTPGLEYIEIGNRVRVVGFTNIENMFITCAIFPDNFLPNKQRKIEEIKKFSDNMEKLKDKIENSPDCKEVVEIGRAYFKPKFNKN